MKPLSLAARLVAGGALALTAVRGTAQTIPIRRVSQLAMSDSGVIASVNGVRDVPGVSVLVHDAAQRKLLLFDSTLKHIRVIADTAKGAPNLYGTQGGAFLRYLGDSAVFVDREAGALVVVAPDGRFVHAMAPVNLRDLNYLMSPVYGTAGFDPQGRLVYRGDRSFSQIPPRVESALGKPIVTYRADSSPILRAEFDRRTVDTIGMIHVTPLKMVTIRDPSTGRGGGTVAVNPVTTNDDWALLPDGTVAVIRAHDYHVEWISPAGVHTVTPKMPFAWRPLPLEEKQRLLDSALALRRVQDAKNLPSGAVKPVAVDPSELPDFFPPLRPGFVRADLEGALWILPSTSSAARGGLLYDVVNRKGEVFERVQLPQGRNLVGFGPRGVIYMTLTNAPGDVRLERARVVR